MGLSELLGFRALLPSLAGQTTALTLMLYVAAPFQQRFHSHDIDLVAADMC
jgi:hypothetical protein